MTDNTILLVEDDEDIAAALKKSLEGRAFRVIRASDGYEALYKYIKEKPGMVILDVVLPKLNGYEVCREIRRRMNDEKTPIIMMTGCPEDYGRIKGKVIGATKYLVKPFGLDALLDEIRTLAFPKKP